MSDEELRAELHDAVEEIVKAVESLAAKRIVSTRDTLAGAWRFDGTRIPVDIIAQQIDHVSIKPEDIPHYYPSLTVADAYAALEWAECMDPGEDRWGGANLAICGDESCGCNQAEGL